MPASDDKPAPPAPAPAPAKKPTEDPDADLSEEDRTLKEKLQLMVERAQDTDVGVQKLALETIRSEIRSATSSMTSVPKPLKFLRPHFPLLKEYYVNSITDGPNKVFLADILSVLSMTMGDEKKCESLRFKLRGSDDPPHLWGHEYVRHLAGEIAQEYRLLTDAALDEMQVDGVDPTFALSSATLEEVHALVSDIVPFLISSNAEPEAVDLLMEVESLAKLVEHTDEHNYSRVCLYLRSCADYVTEQEDVDELLKIAAEIYAKVSKLPEAMEVAIRRGDLDLITTIYKASKKPSAVRLQLALDLGRAGILLDEEIEDDEDLRAAMSNRKLCQQFVHLAKDLDVLEPKTPEDIYKTHLLDSRSPSSTANLDSARANLASSFVNAFVNMGFGKDKLMLDPSMRWIHRNKEHGMMSAAASLGMIMLWDVDVGLSNIDKYMYAEQEYVRAGALLAVGVVSANVRHEVDPPLYILTEHVTAETTPSIRNGAMAGLGIAYAGTNKAAVKELLLPILMNGEMSSDTVSIAALSLGLVYIGSADEDLSMALLQVLSDRKEAGDVSEEPLLPIFLPLSLGLLYLGRQDSAEVVSETIEAMVGSNTLLGRITSITVQACAYCSSGNVLKIQKFLSICGEHPSADSSEDEVDVGTQANGNGSANGNSTPAEAGNESGSSDAAAEGTSGGDAEAGADGEEKKLTDAEARKIAIAEQAVAVLGLAMVSMGEELGAEMSIRTFGHLLQYGDPVIRRVVPLGIGLLSVSNPKLGLMDLLSKFTHDSDMEVAQSAIMALGLIGAGTNNSRIAGMLRQLSVYYSKEPSSLFLVRIAQGLLHSGKGLVTMNPFYGDSKFLENKTGLGGLLTVLFCCLDMKRTILGKSHFLLYFLSLSARPRMVFTVDDKMEFLSTSVRVGQAVDTVGQAGRPKSITGFQTHTTPVLLAAGERSEMATEQYISLGASMEGVVVLEKNPDWVDESGLAEAAAAMDKAEAAKAEAAKAEAAKAEAAKAEKAKAEAAKVEAGPSGGGPSGAGSSGAGAGSSAGEAGSSGAGSSNA